MVKNVPVEVQNKILNELSLVLLSQHFAITDSKNDIKLPIQFKFNTPIDFLNTLINHEYKSFPIYLSFSNKGTSNNVAPFIKENVLQCYTFYGDEIFENEDVLSPLHQFIKLSSNIIATLKAYWKLFGDNQNTNQFTFIQKMVDEFTTLNIHSENQGENNNINSYDINNDLLAKVIITNNFTIENQNNNVDINTIFSDNSKKQITVETLSNNSSNRRQCKAHKTNDLLFHLILDSEWNVIKFNPNFGNLRWNKSDSLYPKGFEFYFPECQSIPNILKDSRTFNIICIYFLVKSYLLTN